MPLGFEARRLGRVRRGQLRRQAHGGVVVPRGLRRQVAVPPRVEAGHDRVLFGFGRFPELLPLVGQLPGQVFVVARGELQLDAHYVLVVVQVLALTLAGEERKKVRVKLGKEGKKDNERGQRESQL